MTRGRSTEVVLREGLLAEKRRRAARMKLLYVFFLLAFVNLFIFRYLPMYGAIIAFKKYRISQGILGSEWNNFEHFRMLFANPYFFRIMRNSVLISVYRIVFGFPAPILLALLINEVSVMSYKRVVQSIAYLPHFMSWVVLAGIVMEILSPQRGLVRYLFLDAGHEVPNLLIDKRHFRALLVATDIWKEVGWGDHRVLGGHVVHRPGAVRVGGDRRHHAAAAGLAYHAAVARPGDQHHLHPAARLHPRRRLRPDLQPVQSGRLRGGGHP